MLNQPLSNDDAKRLVVSILEAGTLRYTAHAEREMAKDELEGVDVQRVLRAGWVEFSDRRGCLAVSRHDAGVRRCRVRVGVGDGDGDSDGVEDPMKCTECGVKLVHERGEWSGYMLPGITLLDVPLTRCPACGETTRGVERASSLLRVIVGELIAKLARMTSDEIRFLRKHLGLSGQEFAAHMGTTPETASRWENGVAMGQASDRLLRAMVAIEERRKFGLKRFVEVASTPPRPLNLVLRCVAGRWRVQEQRAA